MAFEPGAPATMTKISASIIAFDSPVPNVTYEKVAAITPDKAEKPRQPPRAVPHADGHARRNHRRRVRQSTLGYRSSGRSGVEQERRQTDEARTGRAQAGRASAGRARQDHDRPATVDHAQARRRAVS